MYIVELFFKIREKIRQQGGLKEFIKLNINKFSNKTPESGAQEENQENDNTCEHIFSAIDSTNTVLACTKCGFIIHTNPEDLKKKNIFEENYDKNNL